MAKRSKKAEKRIAEELNQTGLRIMDIRTDKKPGLLFVCLSKAMIIFLVCCGTVMGFCDAFELPYNKPLIVMYTALVSILISMLYYKKWIFMVGYPLILIFYTFEIVRYYRYANSGFQAIVNTVRIGFADYFDMTFVKNIEEFIENRYVTVTITLMFIILFLIILYNITVSRYMNLAETIGISFIILEFALYIEKKPPMICMIMVMTGCICIGILQRGAWLRTVISSSADNEFVYDRYFKKKVYTTRGSSRAILMTLAFSFAFSAVICISSMGIYHENAGETEEGSVKSSIDDYVQVFVRNGISGLFDRYDSINGLNRGILGGVASVQPDFMTDIVVSFVPSGTDTLYIPGFKASSYYGVNWSQVVRFDGGRLNELMSMLDGELPEGMNLAETENGIVFGFGEAINTLDEKIYEVNLDGYDKRTMEITFFDRWFTDAVPYFTLKKDVQEISSPAYLAVKDETGNGINGRGPSERVGYVPLEAVDCLNQDSGTGDSDIPPAYEYYVYDVCTEIPFNIKEYFDMKFFPEHSELEKLRLENLSYGEDDTKGNNGSNEINEYRLRACEAVKEMFLKEYPYTLTPGRTPSDKDFIRYFLEEQKRGYCSYFASAAVMLLRNMNVPARYVEGYCIPYSLIEEQGLVIPDDIAEMAGFNEMGTEKPVTVEVSDYYAHAWIEIYLDGIGFVPYEVTPPSFETVGMNNPLAGLGSFFQRLLSVDLGIGDISEGNINFQTDSGLISDMSEGDESGNVFVPVIISFLTAAAGWLIYILIRRMLYLRQMKKMLSDGDFAGLVHIQYYEMVALLNKKRIIVEKNPMPMELAERLKTADMVQSDARKENDMDEAVSICRASVKYLIYAERVLYSGNKETYEAYSEFNNWLQKLKKIIGKIEIKEKSDGD